MSRTKQNKANSKSFRSIAEVKEHFLPRFYEEEQQHKKSQDPESFGISLAQQYLDDIRRQLHQK